MSARGAAEASRRFDIARERMLRHDRATAETLASSDGASLLGHVRVRPHGETPGPPRPRVVPAAAAVFHGVLYNEQALQSELADAGVMTSTAALIAALYARDGADMVARLDGEFSLAILDPARDRLVLATDTVGKYPVYWRLDADGLIFASDLSAILKATPSAARLDLRAVADYATLGMVLGDKTLAAGVRQLDPGTVLTYDRRQNHASARPYVSIATFFAPKSSDKTAYFHALETEFARAVNRAAGGPGPIGLSLSGGLDSRAILSVMGHRTPAWRTYTLGVEGCADQAIARRLSAIAGTQHFYFRLDESYLRDFLPNMAAMVSITDGMYLSHGLTEMLAVQFLGETGIAVLLRGHGGELAKAHLAWPLNTDARVYRMQSVDELIPYLAGRANYITPNLPLSRLLIPEAAAAAGTGSAGSFAEVLAETNLSPAECCSYLYVRELNRRSTMSSLELLRTRVEVRMPYLDPAYLRVLLAAPPEWRDSTDIHRRLTTAGMPALASVRNSNTGARANAGPREEFVMDKLNTLLKRLNVSGYRHYHNFDSWMRRMLLESVEAELLAPGARVQAFVPRQVLVDLIRESREGRADRSYLLQLLLILELWQRENGIP
jgi:asparagine synthase (glutamine-hydrolysing)